MVADRGLAFFLLVVPLVKLSSPRRRGPIRRGLAMEHDGRNLANSCGMGPRLGGDDSEQAASTAATNARTNNARYAPRCMVHSVSIGIFESGGGMLRRRVRVCL